MPRDLKFPKLVSISMNSASLAAAISNITATYVYCYTRVVTASIPVNEKATSFIA